MKMNSMSRAQRGTLAAAGLGFVVVILDVSVVNVALDALRNEFATDVVGLQWVINVYTLVFAALLLSAGALGDRVGAKRIYVTGLAIFTVASLACGLSGSFATLMVARAIQGLGAAMLVPNSLSMLQQSFADPGQRGRAVGWWGAAGGVALAAGPVVGGLLISHFDWRSIFLINLPIGLIGLGLALRHAGVRPANRRRHLDVAGQAAAIVALASLTVSLTEAGELGWGSRWVWGGLVLTLVAILCFVLMESRGADPMLPLRLFRSRTFAVVSAAGVIVNVAYYGLTFVFSLFFQLEQHLSAQETGLAFLPMTAFVMVANVTAGRTIGRVGARWLLVLGLVLSAIGYALLTLVQIDSSRWALVVPMLLAAGGIGLVVPTLANATLSSVDASYAGVASGVLNTARQVGGMLGVAVFGLLVRDMTPQAFMRGMHVSIASATGLLLLGAVLARVGMPSGATVRPKAQDTRVRSCKDAA
jgi:DHA2 family methylenomycin A resistance protein-like MFS transporter